MISIGLGVSTSALLEAHGLAPGRRVPYPGVSPATKGGWKMTDSPLPEPPVGPASYAALLRLTVGARSRAFFCSDSQRSTF